MIARIAIVSASACLAALASPAAYLNKPDSWFGSEEARIIAGRILTWQTDQGDWPKNTDTTRTGFTGDRATLKGTFDNKATTDELRFLARSCRVTGDQRCVSAFLRGFDHMLDAQFPNGGWPQYFPLSKQYHRHITFNDNSMIRVMEFLRETATSDGYKFIGSKRRKAAANAVGRGVECIVKCQVVVHGTPTVWCAQHDEVTLAPASARKFELVSLSGSESAGILMFLMSIEHPSPEVIRAVNAGVAWFESAKLEGIRIAKINGDRKVVEDPSAPPLWARFYDIETNRPFFCGRDGVKKHDIAQIESERRNGYAWYGDWGGKVAKAHAEWPCR